MYISFNYYLDLDVYIYVYLLYRRIIGDFQMHSIFLNNILKNASEDLQ